MKKILLIFFLYNCIFIVPVFPHGDLDARIIEVSKEISIASDSAYLYVKRGKLYFQHEDYKHSINDLNKSRLLGYKSSEQSYLLAKNYYQLKDYNNALFYTDLILESDSRHVRSLKLKAQIFLKQERYEASAIIFEEVIQFSSKTFPGNYIDTSISWELLDNEEGFRCAEKIIKKGLETLGKLISLYDRLIELSVKRKDYDAAIAVQIEIVNLSHRKESAFFKLSELYQIKGDDEKALESLKTAKKYFYSLSVRIQNTSSMKELIKNIKFNETHLENI